MRLYPFILVCCLALFGSGCQEVRYYQQAAAGQYQILTHRQRIEKLIADTNTPPELSAKLLRVQGIRRFAETRLKLPAGSHYSKYADLGRPYVVWNIYASPELSLQPYTWWYPIVGRASYRGFFSEADAKKYAKQLEKKGYDVFVGGVVMYSTLGWFEDPILNTFINLPEPDFVDIVFHELAHQRLFVQGDTEFNEAFATAVATEGVKQWYESQDDPQAFKKYQTSHELDAEFTSLVLCTVQELQKVYTNPHLSNDAKLAAKNQAVEVLRARYAALKNTWTIPSPYDEWMNSPINNAKLGTVATYNELVPAFEKILQSCQGDWNKFYDKIEKIASLPMSKRRAALIAAAEGAGAGLKLASGAQDMVAGTQNGVLLGTVENGQVNLFQAADGQIEGHADLLKAGLASPEAQGFSVAVQNGQVTAIFQNSILNND